MVKPITSMRYASARSSLAMDNATQKFANHFAPTKANRYSDEGRAERAENSSSVEENARNFNNCEGYGR